MDATERFAAAVAAPAAEMRLDVAAFCIAAHAHPGLDVDEGCARLDALAARCPVPTFDGLRAYLFDSLGFRGNERDYGDPENSFLDSVVERRLGIPISLAVVTMEVGRRIGVARARRRHARAFPRDGRRARRRVVRSLPRRRAARHRRVPAASSRSVHGSARAFSRAQLAPTPPHVIVGAHARESRERSPRRRPARARLALRAAPRAPGRARRAAYPDRERAAFGALALELTPLRERAA